MPKQENLAQLNLKTDGVVTVKDFDSSAIPERFVQVCKSMNYDMSEFKDLKVVDDLFAGYFVGLAKYVYQKKVDGDIRPLLIMNGNEVLLQVGYGYRYRYIQNYDLIWQLRNAQELMSFEKPDEPVEIIPEPNDPPVAESGVPFRFMGDWVPEREYDNNTYHIDVVAFHKYYFACKQSHLSNIDDRIDDRLLGGPFLRDDLWIKLAEINEAYIPEYTAPEKTYDETIFFLVQPTIENPMDEEKFEVLTPSNRVALECINKACTFRSGINIMDGFFMRDLYVAATRAVILGMELETKIGKTVVVQLPNVIEFIVHYDDELRIRSDIKIYMRPLEECDIDQVKKIISIMNDDPMDKGY